MQLERQHFSAWLQWLCRGGGHEAAKAQYDRVVRMVDNALAESEVRSVSQRSVSIRDDIACIQASVYKQVRAGRSCSLQAWRYMVHVGCKMRGVKQCMLHCCLEFETKANRVHLYPSANQVASLRSHHVEGNAS